MNKGKRAALCVMALCLAGAAALIWLAAVELLDRQAGVNYYADLRRQADETAAEEVVSEGGPTHAGAEEPIEEAESVVSAQHAAKAGPEQAMPSVIDFAGLSETMPDICGWIAIPGTVIDYPVVQGSDNDYYLSHLPDGTENSCGSIMLDAASSPDWSDRVSLLHGHHMRAGTMFGDLQKFEDAGYAAEHSAIELFTPDGDHRIQVAAACVADGNVINSLLFSDEGARLDELIGLLTERSAYQSDIEFSEDDRYILLSTCAYEFDDARFVVLGVFTEK